MKRFVIRCRIVLAISALGFPLVSGCNSGDKQSADLDLRSTESNQGAESGLNTGQDRPDRNDKPTDRTEMPAADLKPAMPSPPKMANSRIIALPPTIESTRDPLAFSVNNGEAIEFTDDLDPPAFAMEATGSDSDVIPVLQANEDGRTQVEVFYATDRASTEANVQGEFLRVFTWPLLAICVTGMFVFFGLSTRRRLYFALSIGVLIVVVTTGHSSWIHWQRLHRLSGHGDTRYTSSLKASDDENFLDYGTCLVSIPPDHRVGHVDSPSLQRFEFSEDPDKHVILERVMRGERDEFFDKMNHRLESGNHETFVFVHGYNVSFESAVKRTAQIAFDLKFGGVPICYSWPSHGELEDYTRDMANADWTVVHLQQFLTELFDETDASRIHLIAHSMGNRALMQALDRLSSQWSREGQRSMSLSESGTDSSLQNILRREKLPRFGHVVMAAPDVGVDEFRQRYAATVREMSSQVTLYASSKDRALMVSTGVHGHDRAGLAGADICIVDGIDTIDVSHIDTSLIGHSYYGDNPLMIDDLRALIQLSRATSERNWLEQVRIASDKTYWKFR